MNTFLPYPDFRASARSLDTQRLNKQILEILQILRALRGVSQGYRYHPATLMWQHHERALASYGITLCNELRERRKTLHSSLNEIISLGSDTTDSPIGLPWWYGNEDFHHSHKLILQWKNPLHYSPIFHLSSPPTQRPLYLWPVSADRHRIHKGRPQILKSSWQNLPLSFPIPLPPISPTLLVGNNLAQYLFQPQESQS